jgi:hypothetical protein
MAPSVATKLADVLPSRLIVTARGDIGMYVERPEDGAIQSMWIRQRDGRTAYSHRIFQPGTRRRLPDRAASLGMRLRLPDRAASA